VRRVRIVALALAACACSQVALTGRSQLLLISDTEMAQLAKQSRVKFLQDAHRQQAIVREQDPDAGKSVPMVNRVATRIVQAAGLENRAQWRVSS
jgi:hypothetical protein